MKLLSDLRYYMKEAFVSFFRAGIMSLTSITTITISLAIFGLILIFSMNLNEFAKVLEGQVDMTIYLSRQYSDEQLTELVEYLDTNKDIEKFELITADQAFKRLKKELDEEDFLLSALDNNPLPDSIELKVKSSLSVHRLSKELRKRFIVIHDVIYGQEIVEKVNRFTSVLKIIGTVMVVLLGLASMFIVSNVIKLTVYARKDEIEIMKLVGATNWFIRTPFIFEGMIQGFLGALSAVIIIWVSYPQIVDNLTEILPFIPFVTDTSELMKMSGKILFSGLFLGMIGSLISVRKFLDA